jgi:hypothetical protein
MNQRVSHWKDCNEICTGGFNEKAVEQDQMWLKSGKNIWHFA